MKHGMLQHVHLLCADLDAAVAFWVKGFGAAFVEFRTFGKDAGAVLDMKSATQIYLRTSSAPNQSGAIDHVGICVDSIEESLKNLLTLPGVSVTREPFVSGTRLCAFIQNADAVSIELMQPNYTS